MKAVAYIRVSSESQVEGHSLDAQERLFYECCRNKGWTPVRVYREEGKSAHADTIRKRPRYVRLPVAVQLCLAWGFERVMKVPLVSIAQVRILAQGAFQPLPGCGTLPERLTPKTHLHREQIRKGLPPARRFGLRDLRFCT